MAGGHDGCRDGRADTQLIAYQDSALRVSTARPQKFTERDCDLRGGSVRLPVRSEGIE